MPVTKVTDTDRFGNTSMDENISTLFAKQTFDSVE